MHDRVQLNRITTPQLPKHLGKLISRPGEEDLTSNALYEGMSWGHGGEGSSKVREKRGTIRKHQLTSKIYRMTVMKLKKFVQGCGLGSGCRSLV
jgi:hypothetical protein